MRRTALLTLLFGLCLPVFSFFPFFYGARSLALGYSSLAFHYDVNALYLNPSLLNAFTSPLGGYQYGSSCLDFRDIGGRLAALRPSDLRHFQDLEATGREAVLAGLRGVFAADSVISGFRMRHPGYAGKGYAVAVATIDAAIVRPLANPVLDKPAAEITDADIASLRLRFIGFHYTDYSLAVALPVSRGLALGATLHYLKGRNAEFTASITGEPFAAGVEAQDLLESAWTAAENGFSRLNVDLAISAEFGPYFKAALAARNLSNPVIATGPGELRLPRRLIAGLAFRPDPATGVYVDIDVARGDLFFAGRDAQPVSLGVEKGLFRNKLLLRAGLLSDLAAKYFLGRRSDSVIGCGLGFNLGRFLVDLALGLDPQGRVKNLGISGFYMVR